ncbi:MAG: Sua5/YciO/YrdC/YwlC family protein [Planctomycetes bacterium]|nr:Sua5/YciO/YrdC/YwlC family protein [Planctomycetota bacterium]
MVQILSWPGDDRLESLGHALIQLRQGRLVIVPTEVGYECVANALDAGAVSSLKNLAGPAEFLAVTLGNPHEIFDWLPFFRGVGPRLVRRFWPGPLIVFGDASAPSSLTRRLPPGVLDCLATDHALGFRLPKHAALHDLKLHIELPLATAPCPGNDPNQWIESLGDRLGVVFTNAFPTAARPLTVVHTNGKRWHLLRAGAISENEIKAAAACHIVFVCTGNTCRSPIAEALCKKMLAQRLGIKPNDLGENGFEVASAGLAAVEGSEAAAEAAAVAQARDADLSGHRTRPLTAELLLDADFLLTMTYSHLRMLHGLRLGIEPRLMSSRNEDIDDPMGGTAEHYDACARQIEAELVELLPEFMEG